MAPVNHTIFHHFSLLPPEIRDQIWHDALPDATRPALFLYQKGCWRPRRLMPGDDDYDHVNEDCNLNMEFDYKLLTPAQYDIPLAFVNREARRHALGWIRAQGLDIRHNENRRPSFIRYFDPDRDALYVPTEKWWEFIREPINRQLQPDLEGETIMLKTYVKHLAVSDSLLQMKASLGGVFEYYFKLEALYVFKEKALTAEFSRGSLKRHQVYEYHPLRRGMFVWDVGRSKFHYEEHKSDREEPTHRLIKKAAERLRKELAIEAYDGFQIQRAKVHARV
ncbi:hypothetical protein V2G26_010203 [Clonostachys chloroleuca]